MTQPPPPPPDDDEPVSARRDRDSDRAPERSAADALAAAAAEPGSDSVLAPDVDVTATAERNGPDARTPDIEKTARAISGPRARSIEITILAVLAVLYTLYFARSFVLPVVFALLLNFLLSPAIRALGRIHLRPPIAAAVVVLGLMGALGGAGYASVGPVQRWASTAPATLQRVQGRLEQLFKPVQQVQRTAAQVEKAAGSVGSGAAEPGEPEKPQVVVREAASLSSRIFGATERLVTATLEIMILLYFLLAGGDLFLQKLIKVLPHFEDKLKAVEIARASESAVSAYLSTLLLVNVLEGIVCGLILWWLGVPNPVLWGALIMVLEFVPYIGAAIAVVALSLAGLTAFDSVGRAMLAPLSFFVVNVVQANIVTPMLQGHRLTLNPVAIFVGLTFFFFIWGIPGAFLAVPLLATLKIVCDHVASLAAIGEFLGERDTNERRRAVRRDEQPESSGRAAR